MWDEDKDLGATQPDATRRRNDKFIATATLEWLRPFTGEGEVHVIRQRSCFPDRTLFIMPTRRAWRMGN